MLITQIEEIQAYLPPSVYEDPEGLLSLTEDAEENLLIPILGCDLYNKVDDIYQSLLSEYGGVLPSQIAKENVTPEVRLVRLCQKSVLYFTVANSSGLLSISLNGGGFNKVGTVGYEPASDKDISRFERDAYFKARRGIDRLLVFLEEDARSESPAFAELWKRSDYFYLHGDLLFSTALDLNRFLNIDANREKFISLLPDIRYCQDNYIAPEVGEELLEAFIASATDGTILSPAAPDVPNPPEEPGTEAGGGQPPVSEPQSDVAGQGGAVDPKVWGKAINLLKMALAMFVENRRPEKQRRYSENESMLSLRRAVNYIASHADGFGPYIKSSPLYREPDTPEVATPDGGQEASAATSAFDYDDPGNAIYVFGRGSALNRH